MINVYPAESRHTSNQGWLKSSFSFSFADYYDPSNMNFGPMRVLNDDVIQPDNGFGMHPHKEMEIVSLVLHGELEHQDSTGNREVLRPGEIQRMSAGTGILHSEINPSKTERAELLQMWFMPNERGLAPSYEQFAYDRSAMAEGLLPIVSNRELEHRTARIHQDMSIYLHRPDGTSAIRFEQAEGRRIFLFVIEGEVELNGSTKLGRRDSARITDTPALDIAAAAGSYYMLIDLP